ncbi:MAG: TonB-dependent receptor [Labilithrix sp.]|nr:TonB-dependent receptor [Labilithrix sp.]
MSRGLRNLVTVLCLGGCFGALSLAPAPAHAQTRPSAGAMTGGEPTAEPKTKEQLEAQQHFQRAKDLYSAGSYREATAELEAAHALDPKAKDLVFNLGIVAERMGKYDEAVGWFQKYMQMDGVTASERGKAENVIKRIEGAKREAAAAKPTRTTTEADARRPEQPIGPQPEPKRPHGRIDAATVATGSVALVALGASAVFGVLALSNEPGKDYVTGRDGSYADLQAKTDDAHTQALVADVALGVGIVALAVTAYLYFGRTREPSRSALSAEPLLRGTF